MHEKLDFLIQTPALYCSLRVSIEQFGNDVFRVTKDQDPWVVFLLKNLQALEEG